MEPSLKDLFFSFVDPEFSDKIAVNLIHNPALNPSISREVFSKTYKELFQDVMILIDYLSGKGLQFFHQPGQVIGLIGSNSYEWILAFWAAVITGHKVALIDSYLMAEEIHTIIKKLHASFLFASPEVARKCSFPVDDGDHIVLFGGRERVPGGFLSFYDVFGGAIINRPYQQAELDQRIREVNNIPFELNQMITLVHTSGTTSNTKIVGLSSKNLLSLVDSIEHLVGGRQSDVTMAILPMHHVYGLITVFLMPMFYHVPITLLREINSQNITKAIQNTHVSIIPAVPAVLKLLHNQILARIESDKILKATCGAYLRFSPKQGNRLLDMLILRRIKNRLGRDLRLFVSGGARSDYEVTTFFGRLGIPILEGYGLTETAGPVTFNPIHEYKIGSVGKAIGDTVCRIKEANDQGIGEIWIKGPSVFSGYLDREDLNGEIFDQDGFFNTGDIGYIDSQGYVFICGRKKDVIVLPSGKNVYPEELEEYYGKSPYIREIAVVGRLENNAESAHAVILPDFQYMKRTGSEDNADDLISRELNRLSAGLPSYKRIAGFTLVRTQLPKTNTLKFKKELIKNLLSSPPQKAVVAPEPSEGEMIPASVPSARSTREKRAGSWFRGASAPSREAAEDKGQAPKIEKMVMALLKNYLPEQTRGKDFESLKKMHLENELKLDSILQAEILFTLENMLGLKIDLLKANQVQTLEDFMNLIPSTSPLNPSICQAEFGPDNGFAEKYAFFDLSPKAVQARLLAIEKKIGEPLSEAGSPPVSAQIYRGHIENYLWDTHIPTGIIGPIRVNGDFAQGEFYVPLASTEGALVASVHRGAMVINACQGADVKILNQQIIRSPVFIFQDLKKASLFNEWVRNHFGKIKAAADSTSSYARLKDIERIQHGRRVTLRFLYTSGDAAGQNMSTKATAKACQYMVEAYKDKDASLQFFLENNLSGDKKCNYLNFTTARGKRVTAEVRLKDDIVNMFFHTSCERMFQTYQEGLIGTALSASVGMNAHMANIIAATFIATGQDAACTHESAMGLTTFEMVGKDLVAGVLLPCLVVGTLGGGTNLPSQAQNLKIMECSGPMASRFTEIITATVLAGELSIIASHAAGDFTSAHMRFGR